MADKAGSCLFVDTFKRHRSESENAVSSLQVRRRPGDTVQPPATLPVLHGALCAALHLPSPSALADEAKAKATLCSMSCLRFAQRGIAIVGLERRAC